MVEMEKEKETERKSNTQTKRQEFSFCSLPFTVYSINAPLSLRVTTRGKMLSLPVTCTDINTHFLQL